MHGRYFWLLTLGATLMTGKARCRRIMAADWRLLLGVIIDDCTAHLMGKSAFYRQVYTYTQTTDHEMQVHGLL